MKTTIKILSANIISVIPITGYTYANSNLINKGVNLSRTLNVEINNKLDTLNNKTYNSFKIKILKDNNIFLENGIWYTYNYTQYKKLGEGYVLSKNNIKSVGLNTDTTILLLDNQNSPSFITDYKKVKLVSDYIISGITNKQEFLNKLADDKKYLDTDTDNLFLNLKSETDKLTQGLDNNDKISKIYDYILKNISYSEIFSIDNKEIFSGIDTYKNKDGICGGYSKLYLYMLSFAGVSDVEVKTGYLLDSKSFPNIGHAWVKIGDKFYDPTYDDPIGNTKAKTYNNYKYFEVQKDIFYINKYDHGTMPSYLKTKSLEYRKNLIKNRILKLSK